MLRALVACAASALLLFACSRRERANRDSPDAATAITDAATLAVIDAAASPFVPDPTSPLVSGAVVSTCVASHSCSLSHPGLGSSSYGTSVDFATCTRTSWSHSSAYRPSHVAPTPEEDDLWDEPSAKPKAKAKAPEPAPSPVPRAACDRMKKLTLAITRADLIAAQESAHVDTTACMLDVACGAPDRNGLVHVQRQTYSGPGSVQELSRAVHGGMD